MATPVVSLPVPAVVGTERSKKTLRKRKRSKDLTPYDTSLVYLNVSGLALAWQG